jgi:hypothetical protein
VGIAEATVATAAALAPASVASASRHVPKRQYVYKAIDQTSQTCTQARRRVFILRWRCVHSGCMNIRTYIPREHRLARVSFWSSDARLTVDMVVVVFLCLQCDYAIAVADCSEGEVG